MCQGGRGGQGQQKAFRLLGKGSGKVGWVKRRGWGSRENETWILLVSVSMPLKDFFINTESDSIMLQEFINFLRHT